jgi:hypothetical protein
MPIIKASSGIVTNQQVVMQLIVPLQHLKGITSVAEVFRDAEDARKLVQEKVAGEMDNL